MGNLLEELRSSWLAVSLLLVAGILFVSAAAGDLGLSRAFSLEKELAAINQSSFHLIQEIDHNREQIRKINEDDRTLETVARQRLHLVREGDTLYRIGTEN